jgi:hypothetical protein
MSIPARAILLGAASAAALAFTAAPALTQVSSQTQRVVPKLCQLGPNLQTRKEQPYAFAWYICGGNAGSIGANAAIRYYNFSGVKHRLKIGAFVLEPFSSGSRVLKVHLASGTRVHYECTLHPTKMHGTIKVV